MLRALKERKRTMHSERKRTGCPTLLFCSFLFYVPSLTPLFALSFFMFHLSLPFTLFPFLCSISHSLFGSFLFLCSASHTFFRSFPFYVPSLTPSFALSFFMFHLSRCHFFVYSSTFAFIPKYFYSFSMVSMVSLVNGGSKL